MIIVTTSPDWRETGSPVHTDGGIAIAHFEMDAADTLLPRAVQEIVEQQPADPPALFAWEHREKQELGFIRNGSEQRKTDDSLARPVNRELQEHPRDRENAAELGTRPCLAELVAEGL